MLQLGLTNLWVQQGIIHLEAAARAEAGGIHVVMDRCIMVEHRRMTISLTNPAPGSPTIESDDHAPSQNVCCFVACAFFLHAPANAQIQVVGDGGPGPVKAQHLTVELVSQSTSIAPGGTLQAGLVLHPRRALARLLDQRRRLRRAAQHHLDPASRHHRRPHAVSHPHRLPLGPLMDFGYSTT